MTPPLPTEWTPPPRRQTSYAERRARSAPELADLSDEEVRAVAGRGLEGLRLAIRAEADAARAAGIDDEAA